MFSKLLASPKSDVPAVNQELHECKAKLDAISSNQAVIEFELDGTVTDANENFLSTLGYRLDEIAGRHHRLFVSEEERESAGYVEFWNSLNAGVFQSGKFRRIHKDGSDVWIQAMYYPINGADGRPMKVVKFASDITAQVALEKTDRRSRLGGLG